MSVSSIAGSTAPTIALSAQSGGKPSQPQAAKPASDGDPPSVEASENAATKLAEKTHGGFVNKLV